jgi:transcriptional regulator with XRE-family HTH domain
MSTVVDPMNLAINKRIRWARKRAGLSQLRFAELLGTSPRHVIRWENGQHRPSAAYAIKIAEVTGQPSALFEPDDDEEDE